VVGKINNIQYNFVIDRGAIAFIINADNLPLGIKPKPIELSIMVDDNNNKIETG